MAIKYLKKAIKTPSTDDRKTRSVVQIILDDIEKTREEGIKKITKKETKINYLWINKYWRLGYWNKYYKRNK